MPKRPPDDDDWIGFENQEIQPQVWWLTIVGAVVAVALTVTLILVCT